MGEYMGNMPFNPAVLLGLQKYTPQYVLIANMAGIVSVISNLTNLDSCLGASAAAP
jgi:hypothetical protein